MGCGVDDTAFEFDVFISYHSGDAEWVGRLKSALVRTGLKVWLDSEQIRPGDVYVKALEQGIESSRSVALVVSAASLRSKWVGEEYCRALANAHALERQTRIIPVLIEDVPLPGFLANREYADFRSDDGFDNRVAELRAGILGDSGASPDPIPATPGPQTDEIEYLLREVKREEVTVRRLMRTRYGAVGAGASMGLLVTSQTWGVPDLVCWLIPMLASLFMGLIGVSATAKEYSRSTLAIQHLTGLRNGLELCRARRSQGCVKLWTEFWRVMHRSAGLDTNT